MVGKSIVPIVDSILNWNESILFETIAEEHDRGMSGPLYPIIIKFVTFEPTFERVV